MNRLLTLLSLLVKKRSPWVAMLLACLVWLAGTLPVQARVPMTPRLEEQILQVIRDHPEAILESVQTYQQQQQQALQQVQQAALQEMKANPAAAIAGSPTTGAAEQKIVLLEFSDFQCPYCAEAHTTLKQFMSRHQGEVTLVYKHFPLTSVHPEAVAAAKAAWAAGQQGKFWPYHDALFQQREKLGEALYLATAKALNLDLDQFNRDRQGQSVDLAIAQDIELAEKFGIQGTPFFVMNGETFSGNVPLSDMEDTLMRVNHSQANATAS